MYLATDYIHPYKGTPTRACSKSLPLAPRPLGLKPQQGSPAPSRSLA